MRKIFILLLTISFISCFSQGWDPEPADPGFGGGAGDPATEPIATPIDGLEAPLIVTAIVGAVVLTRRKQKYVS